jgi:hypothetical protein
VLIAAALVLALATAAAVARLYFGFDFATHWAGELEIAGIGDFVLVGLAAALAGTLGTRWLRRGRARWLHREPAAARVWRSERGMALPMALGIMVVLLISAIAVTDYSIANSRNVNRFRQRGLSYVAAETGMNNAFSWLYTNSGQWHATSPITVGPVSASATDGLLYTYTLTPNFPVWTVSVVGTAPNKTQGGRLETTKLTRQVKVQEVSNGVNINIWNLYFSDATAGTPGQCMHWNAIIEDPIYVRGDLCVDAGGDSDSIPGWPPATLPGSPQLMVGGHIYITPPGHLGWSGNHLNIVQTGIGCALYNSGTPGATHNPCNASDNIVANSYLTGPLPTMVKPTVDLATWYKDALPGPQHNCTSGSFPGGFDTNTIQDNSLGTVNLTPVAAYDCQFTDGTGAMVGRVKWTPGSPGNLVINGTVFWDGNLVVSNSFNYTGRATFYFGGTVTLNSGVSVCGIASCASSWNTDTSMLVLVAGSPNQSPSWAINSAATSKMQGAMEAVGDINQNNGATMWGGLIAHQLYNISANDNWVPFNTGTAGQPAQGTYQEGIIQVPGSFTG